MDATSIAAASINMSLLDVGQAAGTAILKKSMDTQQSEASALINSMANLSPYIGQNFDIKA